MPLCILSGITTCNKSFYIGFAFLWNEDKDSYGWVITQVKELYTRVGQEDGPEVVLTDREDALIGNLHEIMPATHLILCVLNINENIQARASKYFSKKESCQAWMRLWHKVCQAATLAEYNHARAELEIADPSLIAEYRDSLFQYADREYLANGNNQKHCYFWTNGIRHFNKRVTSTSEGGYANVKRALESTLGDLPEVVRVIREKIEDQLCKIRLQHSSDKNGNIRASLNICIFCYLKHEISEYALGLIATHAKGVNTTTVLPEYTGVFTKTLGLPCKHKIQESFETRTTLFDETISTLTGG